MIPEKILEKNEFPLKKQKRKFGYYFYIYFITIYFIIDTKNYLVNINQKFTIEIDENIKLVNSNL